MLKDIFLGLRTFLQARKFMAKNKLRVFYLIPLGFTSILFWITTKVSDRIINFITELLYDSWGLDNIVASDGFLDNAIEGILYWVVKIVSWFIILIINKYIVLIALSPVFSFLSEKVEHAIKGTDYPFDMKQVFKDALRGAWIAARNFIIEISVVVICLVIQTIFAPAAIVTIPLMWIVAAYFVGYSFLDYNYERQRLTAKESKKEIWRRKGLSFANGALFSLLAYIPIIGVAFGALWSTVGAALAIHQPKPIPSAD